MVIFIYSYTQTFIDNMYNSEINIWYIRNESLIIYKHKKKCLKSKKKYC